jgi:hypothetical protein
VYYVNDPVVLGHVTQRSDLNIGGGLNTGEITSGLHAHAAYALTSQFFATGSFTGYKGGCTEIRINNGDTIDNSIHYSGNSFLAGFGYYKALGNHFYFESCGGIKYGANFNWKSTETIRFYHLKYFLQPAFTYARKYFQAGAGVRFGIIDYLPVKTGSLGLVPGISGRSPVFYADPSIELAAGGSKLKLGLQVSGTFSDMGPVLLDPLANVIFGNSSTDLLSISFFLRFSFSTHKHGPIVEPNF